MGPNFGGPNSLGAPLLSAATAAPTARVPRGPLPCAATADGDSRPPSSSDAPSPSSPLGLSALSLVTPMVAAAFAIPALGGLLFGERGGGRLRVSGILHIAMQPYAEK